MPGTWRCTLRSIRYGFPRTALAPDRFGLGDYDGMNAIDIIDRLLE